MSSSDGSKIEDIIDCNFWLCILDYGGGHWLEHILWHPSLPTYPLRDGMSRQIDPTGPTSVPYVRYTGALRKPFSGGESFLPLGVRGGGENTEYVAGFIRKHSGLVLMELLQTSGFCDEESLVDDDIKN